MCNACTMTIVRLKWSLSSSFSLRESPCTKEEMIHIFPNEVIRRSSSNLKLMLFYSFVGQECFPVWAELRRRGGGVFVMRLRSMHIRKVGPSSLRSREDRSRAYSLSFNPYIFPLFIVFSHPSHGFSTGMLVTSSLWNTF